MNEAAHLPAWRFLVTPANTGAWNMALDEAILESVERGHALPTLRVYAWQPACLSLGYAQKITDVDRGALELRAWDLVRRPTGGRAILHTDELTYAVMAPLSDPHVAGNVLESYRRLSTALVAALQTLGLDANADREYDLPSSSQPNGAVCFEVPANYEITVAGKKLIGSAQARRFQGVLQHGSLPLCGDLTRILSVLAYPDETARNAAALRLLDHAATFEDLSGRQVTWEQAAQALFDAYQTTQQVRLIRQPASPAELVRAAELVAVKDANPAWTERL